VILQQLTLRNFGLFRGKQAFDLAPAAPNGKSRPVVLFGGINGGGKTTLFDAIQRGEANLCGVDAVGLARAAARPLPAVIDTPMARLDAVHRQNLIERYLPHASHQFVLLSTDPEVDRHYYPLLQPFLARAYHLNYDEDSRVTVGEGGISGRSKWVSRWSARWLAPNRGVWAPRKQDNFRRGPDRRRQS
jgi:hypothetical protein